MIEHIKLPLFLLVALECGLLLAPTAGASEVSALAEFKRGIFEDPFSVLADWNSLDADPCRWSGVTCSKPLNRVISLDLSNSSLKGFISPDLGELPFLQGLILSNNLFLGTIPKEIGLLKSLNLLDLSRNSLTGHVPPEMGSLTSLKRIYLNSNGLTGVLPSEFGNLVGLVELRLDRNRLGGLVPGNEISNTSLIPGAFASKNHGSGLCLLPHLKVGDFSYNFFVGKIPPCLKFLARSSFQGNCFQDNDAILQRSSLRCTSSKQELPNTVYKNSNDGPKHKKERHPEWLLILELIAGPLVALSLIIATIAATRRCKRKTSTIIPWKRDAKWKDSLTITIDEETMKNFTQFRRDELEVACEDFSNIIGSPPDSIIYKGTMKDNREIAVISLVISKDHWASHFEFYFNNMIADFMRLNHENVAKFLGYCKEGDPFSRMLIFDYAPNGTLYEHLHYGEECQLSWLRRMKIVIGIARGLKYLHTELEPPFAVSELNSNVVYLTEDFLPKLVDFGSWKVTSSKSEKSSGFPTNGGPYSGFVDSLEQRRMDIQMNTLTFGVLVLEIISGKLPYREDNKKYSVDWAMEYLQDPEKVGKLVDPRLPNIRNDDLDLICSIVSQCIDPDPSKRPSMQTIAGILEDGIDLSGTAVLKNSPWAELALS